HAFQLWQSLQRFGVTPRIVTNERPFFAPDQAVFVTPPPPRRLTTSKLVWPNLSYRRAMDLVKAGDGNGVFHGLSNINVPWQRLDRRLKTVVTVHDLTPLLAPAMVSPAYALQFSFAIKRIIRKVDAIVAVSDWT